MDYPFWAAAAITWATISARLNPYSNGLPVLGNWNYRYHLPAPVLIPILMDYPFWDMVLDRIEEDKIRLNPYSNGLPSRGLKNLWKWI